MTDLSYVRPVAASPARGGRLSRPALLYAGVAIAGAAGVLLGHGGGAGMDPHLAVLLRFMAVVKGGMALGALALVQWRLHRPASDRLALGYGAALVLMAAAPGLIWGLSAIPAGAGIFHAGLFAFLILAWRDDAVALRA